MKSRMKKKRFLIETFHMALTAIFANRLRSWLTITVIAIGITSLVGALTAVDAIRSSINDTYSKLGSSSITITQQYSYTSSVKKRVKNPPYITMAQAKLFKDYYTTPSIVSIHSFVIDGIRAESGGKLTNPNINIIGCDENLLLFKNLTILKGRSFNIDDISAGRNYCIIGCDIANTLFPEKDAIGNQIFIKGHRYTIIGQLSETGYSANGNIDTQILIPYTNAAATNLTNNTLKFVIGILPDHYVKEETAASEAENIFRAVRRLAPYDENDFAIRRRETEIREMNSSMQTITILAITIGLITLTGAAVGLMNIMLVSVKERICEIGTRKAIGASSRQIRYQFLMEAVFIGETGGMIGIVTGIIAGNITAKFMDAAFVVPWGWILSALLLCVVVGIISGYIPAKKAASLNPIECLRHE